MKIAFLSISNGRVQRGSEVFVAEIARELSKSDEVTIFQTGLKTDAKYKEIQIKGIPFINYQNNKKLLFIQNQFYHLTVFLFTLKCLKYIYSEKFDWVVPLNGRFQALLCRIFRRYFKFRILISGHAGIGREDKINLWLGKPDVFIALSKKALLWAQKIAPHVQSFYIPNGVNIHQFDTEEKPSTTLHHPIVMCVSALLPYKRIHLLIKAMKLWKDASLLLIGDGELRDEIQRIGSLELKNRFQFITHIPHEEIGKYYKLADVFSLPSKENEAFGLVYLEAMAANVPVVVPDDSNRREIVENGGLYCDVSDSKVYAYTLKKAFTTDFKSSPFNQAEKYSWQKIALQYKAVFDTFST